MRIKAENKVELRIESAVVFEILRFVYSCVASISFRPEFAVSGPERIPSNR